MIDKDKADLVNAWVLNLARSAFYLLAIAGSSDKTHGTSQSQFSIIRSSLRLASVFKNFRYSLFIRYFIRSTLQTSFSTLINLPIFYLGVLGDTR